MPITITRYSNASTTENLRQLLDVIKDPRCDEVCLFASLRSDHPSFCEAADGPATNPPLVAAIATYPVPVHGAVKILFDGNFLNAARSHRAREVVELLDVADQHAGKVVMGKAQVPFTAALAPMDAVGKLMAVGTGSYNRAQYFQLLTAFSEATYPFG